MKRIPGVLAQLVKLEHPPGYAARHHRGVDPVLGRQGTAVDRFEPGGEAVQGAAFIDPGLLGGISQPGVEPVIAQIGGGRRMPFRPVIEILLRQPGEPAIGAVAHLASSSLISAPGLTVTNEMMARCACCCRFRTGISMSPRWRCPGGSCVTRVIRWCSPPNGPALFRPRIPGC